MKYTTLHLLQNSKRFNFIFGNYKKFRDFVTKPIFEQNFEMFAIVIKANEKLNTSCLKTFAQLKRKWPGSGYTLQEFDEAA